MLIFEPRGIVTRAILLSAMVTPLLLKVSAQSQASSIEGEILKVEYQRDAAIQSQDMAVLDRIQSDDLSFVNTRGIVLNKSQYMAEIKSGDLKFQSFHQDEYRFHIFGDTVVVTGRNTGVVEYHGKLNKTPRRFTIVYVKRNGEWKFVSYQATLIPE
jgi:ketosteroid isomerase-like protein